MAWAGTSFTSSNPGYSYTVDQWLRSNYLAYAYSIAHTAVGGNNTWSTLVRLSSEVLSTSPNLVVLDTINDSASSHAGKSLEATIRRIWAVNPATRIILMRFATYGDRSVNANVNSPVNASSLVEFDAIATAYGLTVVDWHGRIQQLVNNEAHNLSEYIAEEGATDVHPSSGGYTVAAELLEAVILTGGATKPGTLPARLYDTSGYFENTPTKKLGTAYDSRTGTWADSGGEVSSSTAASTITYTVTSAPAHSIGCYRADGGTNTVEISFDGGSYSTVTFYQNGVEVPGGFTTATIKVSSGTVKIGEFWAV